jgi:hypothetical protein
MDGGARIVESSGRHLYADPDTRGILRQAVLPELPARSIVLVAYAHSFPD